MQRVGINAAGQDFARVRLQRVIRARQPRDRIEQDDDVLLVFDEPLGFFEHHLRDLRVPLGRFVEGRTDNLSLDRALEVGHFLGTLIDQQHDEDRLGVVREDEIGDLLQQDCLARARRRHNQPTLAFANRCKQIHRPGC